jgi:hypothetical protein
MKLERFPLIDLIAFLAFDRLSSTAHFLGFQVKSGASPVETCEIFESVTIVFNDIPMFSDICAQCDGKRSLLFIRNISRNQLN